MTKIQIADREGVLTGAELTAAVALKEVAAEPLVEVKEGAPVEVKEEPPVEEQTADVASDKVDEMRQAARDGAVVEVGGKYYRVEMEETLTLVKYGW
jgi:hypothetical protein